MKLFLFVIFNKAYLWISFIYFLEMVMMSYAVALMYNPNKDFHFVIAGIVITYRE